MDRLIMQELLQWKNSVDRKPLLLKGARQVGKTFVCLDFGKQYYQNVVYLHFEGAPATLRGIFQADLNPNRIIEELSVYTKQTILPEKTLLIFDEIQACEEALTSLKYFNEEANDYHIIAAGSFLGLALNREKYSFPVGKVDLKTLYPLNFKEFLLAVGENSLVQKIEEAYANTTPLADVYHEAATDWYKKYLVVGGYPAVVTKFAETSDYNTVRAEQANIADSYIADMAKYATPQETVRSIAIFNTLPSQLAKENTKFQYSVIKSNARAKDYESSLHWLKNASVVLENLKITEGKIPETVYEEPNSFKIYYSDVGLLCLKSGILPQDILVNSNISDRARGLLAENYVAQQLVSSGYKPHYWEYNGQYEVDFVCRINDDLIPIEAKWDKNVKASSLNVYTKKYTPSYSIRVSLKNLGFENNIKSIPLYALFCL